MKTRFIPSSGAAPPVVGCGTWRGFDVGARPADLPVRGEVLASLFEAGGGLLRGCTASPCPPGPQKSAAPAGTSCC